MTFWNFERVFLETRFLETVCKISRNLANRLPWNLVRVFSVTFTKGLTIEHFLIFNDFEKYKQKT